MPPASWEGSLMGLLVDVHGVVDPDGRRQRVLAGLGAVQVDLGARAEPDRQVPAAGPGTGLPFVGERRAALVTDVVRRPPVLGRERQVVRPAVLVQARLGL